MVIPFLGTKSQNNVKINDTVSFINRSFGSMCSKGIVTKVEEDYVTVVVTEGNFSNCIFTVPVNDCTLI